jgi:hypothetical protein
VCKWKKYGGWKVKAGSLDEFEEKFKGNMGIS